MLNGSRIAVVLPAYNAAATMTQTVAELDRDVVDDLLVVDDASTDDTVRVARRLGIEPILHDHNDGYGANQKTCYRAALDLGADVVVMLHPDYQYSPRLVVPMAAMIAYGEYDMVLGSRILAQNAVEGGMPRYKYVSNRALTLFENLVVGNKLSEYHTGLRAFNKELLDALRLDLNSNGFLFDNQVIVQAMAAEARIGELSCPAHYFEGASSVSFTQSVRYGLGVVKTALQYRAHVSGLRRQAYLELSRPLRPAPPGAGASPAT
jgi:glycosyltransferase involved in cell wall biosynthesis